VPSILLVHPTVAAFTRASAGRRTPRPDGLTKAGHWASSSLPSRLNREWALLCDNAAGSRAVRGWAAPCRDRAALSELADMDGLQAVVRLLQSGEVTASGRDGVLGRAQDGDRLAGRVVLQTMLPARSGSPGRLPAALMCSVTPTRRSPSCWPRCGRSSRPTRWLPAGRSCQPTSTWTRSRWCGVATPAAPTGELWFSASSPTPTSGRPRPVLLAGQAPDGLWDALAAQVQARGFELKRGDCGAANGLTHYGERTVTVRADVDDAQAVKTLAHELGHVLLHDPTGLAIVTTPGMARTARDPVLTPETVGASAGQCRGRLEVEAESVAYLVASAHGLETGAYTFAYVAGWAGEVAGVEVDQVVRGTANRVLAATKVVLAGTEHLLEQTDQGQVLARDLTLAADAARGAERTAALLTDAVGTAQSAQRTAANVPPAPSPAPVVAAAAAHGDRPATAAAGPTRERLIEVHALAVGFYAERLHAGGPDARRAVALLTERGVDRDSAGAARLGYAPRAWTNLVNYLRTAGVDHDELRASGLVLKSSRGTLVDRFRDRVIFPVDTLAGQTVALLGRAVDQSATDRNGVPVPKYLNSPQTAVYSKGEHLYGLGGGAADAIAEGAKPVLVEGPMDVLAVNRAATASASGAPRHVAVAPCGTALTVQQVQLLDTVCGGLAERGVVTAFDGDDAGRQAGLRAYDLLRAVRAWPTALDLPAGQDPASLAAEYGTAGLQAALLAAAGRPLADVVVDERIARHHLRWTEGQVAAGRAAALVVAKMPPEHVTRQIVRVAAHTGWTPTWSVTSSSTRSAPAGPAALAMPRCPRRRPDLTERPQRCPGQSASFPDRRRRPRRARAPRSVPEPASRSR